MPSLSKNQVCLNALTATGNFGAQIDGDNSDEWRIASNAYDRMLPVIMAKHNWKFSTDIVALARSGDSTFPGYQDAFAKPGNCLHIEDVWDTYVSGLIQPSAYPIGAMSTFGIRAPPLEYRIIGDLIHCTTFDGRATALFVVMPEASSNASVLFAEALTTAVEEIIVRGLNEDLAAAERIAQLSEMALREARQSADSEEPRAIPFRSPMRERRRGRRMYGAW